MCWIRKQSDGTVFLAPSAQGLTNCSSGIVKWPAERAWTCTVPPVSATDGPNRVGKGESDDEGIVVAIPRSSLGGIANTSTVVYVSKGMIDFWVLRRMNTKCARNTGLEHADPRTRVRTLCPTPPHTMSPKASLASWKSTALVMKVWVQHCHLDISRKCRKIIAFSPPWRPTGPGPGPSTHPSSF